MTRQKYSIGIDLGTTHCVVAYAPLDAERPLIELLRIEQLTATNETELRDNLPSFLYIPTEAEEKSGGLRVPGFIGVHPTINGVFARTIAAEQPERTIAAAKSWLCHAGVDRYAPILPWGSPDEMTKLSPVSATKYLLRHLVDAWRASFPDDSIADQSVTLTVPASFDLAARELTREAALAAGLPDGFILLEEPQAAVYHWLESTGERWRRITGEGDTLLVCDVGGGTTDLTLVRVEQEGGELVLRRLAVGNHLLVGGDNMDLALAHLAATKFAEKGVKLNPWQAVSMWHSCRKAKESLLSSEGSTTETLSVLGRGSKLIGGTVSIEIEKSEVQTLLVDGFFPKCSIDAIPTRNPSSGFQELGLPFESDSAITRHVAAFLSASGEVEGSPRVHLLLNGGVFKSTALASRLVETIGDWGYGQGQPQRLGSTDSLDHAVARGAAYYGWAKSRGGVRIRGGTARSYYVGIETSGLAIPGMPRPLQAVCVVPFGMEEGTETDVPGREVGLIVGRQASFRFFASGCRKEDRPGTTLRSWDEDELLETAPMELTLDVPDAPQSTELQEGGVVPVRFHSRISELGVFELWCNSTRDSQRWKLEFNVREDAEVSAT